VASSAEQRSARRPPPPAAMPNRVALAAALVGVSVAAAADLHCVGRLAHKVVFSSPTGALADASLAVAPAPERDHECHRDFGVQGTVGGLSDRDRRICVGANADETCQKARKGVIPLPEGARCQGCFAGALTDMYYTLNMSRLHLHHAGVGFRGTRFHSILQVEDDEGKASKVRRGSKTFGEKPIEWKLRLGAIELDLKIAMPTEVYYELQGREGAHGDIGADLTVDLGDNYIEYTEGKGWSHHKDKARYSFKPIHEGDYDATTNLTVGVKSRLQAEVGKLMWFHMDVVPQVPMGFFSVGASGSDLIQGCVDATMKLDVGHEAAVDVSFFNQTISKHWGPTVDRHSDRRVVHKCEDLHPRQEPSLLV